MIIIAGVSLVFKQGESSITDLNPGSTCRFKCQGNNKSQPFQRLPSPVPIFDPSQASALKKLIWELVVKSFTMRISQSHHHQHWKEKSQHGWYNQILNISSRSSFFNLLLVSRYDANSNGHSGIAQTSDGINNSFHQLQSQYLLCEWTLSWNVRTHLEISQLIYWCFTSWFFRLGFSKHSLSL